MRYLPRALSLLLLTSSAGLLALFTGSAPAIEQREPFRLGFVLDFTGALAEHGGAARRGAELAIRQINAAGGVWGQNLVVTFADGATDPAAAAQAAKTLISEGRVHAIVGAMGSASTLRMAREVTIPAGVPIISPSATAPEISRLDDHDLVFRATPSDAAQGPVLARLLREDRAVAVLYRDDAYGRGLFEAFRAAYSGEILARAIVGDRTSYLPELQAVAGPPALLALTYPEETEVLVGEALRAHLFSRFVFTDATRMPELMDRIDPVALEGAKGTSPALREGVDQPSTKAFVAAHRAAFGQAPTFGSGSSVFDAVVCLGLAAEAAGPSAGPAEVRDRLRQVCGGPGEVYIASATSVAEAFAAVRAGREIDYLGAGSTMDWNRDGDVATGFVDIWAYSKGAIASLELVPFDLSDGATARPGR